MVVEKSIEHQNSVDERRFINPAYGCPLQKRDFSQRPMSLRKFLEPFDHKSLTNSEAGGKYAAYKASYARQQLEEFFERNKSQAWFREKYHPDYCTESESSIKHVEQRLQVFMDMYNEGSLDNIHLTTGCETDIIRLLDTFAIKLAGGTDEDVEFMIKYCESKKSNGTHKDSHVFRTITGTSISDAPIAVQSDQQEISPQKLKSVSKSRRENSGAEEGEDISSDSESSSGSNGASSSSSDSSSSGSDSSSNSSSGSCSDSDDDADVGKEKSHTVETNKREVKKQLKRKQHSDSRRSKKQDPVNCTKSKDRSSNPIHIEAANSSSDEDDGPIAYPETKVSSKIPQSTRTEHTNDLSGSDTVNHLESNLQSSNVQQDCQFLDKSLSDVPNLPRPIHHIQLLFLPHIPLNIFKRDLITLFSTCPHFLRLAILDPVIMPADNRSLVTHPDSDANLIPATDAVSKILLKRSGWVSFKSQYMDDHVWREVDLNTIQQKFIQQLTQVTETPTELIQCIRLAIPIVNDLHPTPSERALNRSCLLRDLLTHSPNRLRSKSLIRRHLVMAARLVHELDKARGLWHTLPDVEMLTSDEAVCGHLDLALAKQPTDATDQSQLSQQQTQIVNKATESNGQEETMDLSNSVQNTDTSIVIQQSREEDDDDEDDDPNERVTLKQEKQLVKSSSEYKPSRRAASENNLDPGEDLLRAADILNSCSSRNPLLQGLTDYLVDEGSAEEEILLSGGLQSVSFLPGVQNSIPNFDTTTLQLLESDHNDILIALDRLIIYLRIVHSVDFYAPALYFNEDAMPHPCRLIHVRPNLLEIKKTLAQQQHLNKPIDRSSQYEAIHRLFANQLKRLIRLVLPVKSFECQGLGLRDPDEVAEAFIKSNTRRKKRKNDVIWVCSLSNKKFRDPIFVKKHILNKHSDKIELWKKDNAYFFNNYVLDPARPQLPVEPRFVRRKSRSSSPELKRDREPDSTTTRSSNAQRERSDSWNRFPNRNNISAAGGGGRRWYPFGRRRSDSNTTGNRPGGNLHSNYQRRDYQSNNSFYSSNHGYGRGAYTQFRMPYSNSQFNATRMGYGNNMNNNMRRGNQRRDYIDLDAP